MRRGGLKPEFHRAASMRKILIQRDIIVFFVPGTKKNGKMSLNRVTLSSEISGRKCYGKK
jgi:hypothetical protein